MARNTKRLLGWVLAVVVLFLGLFVTGFLWVSASPELRVGSYQNRVMTPPTALPGKLKERVRLWMRSRNLAATESVVMEAGIMMVDYPVEPELLVLLTNSTFRETSEVQGWIVERGRAEEWRRRLEELPGTMAVASPRIVAGSHQAGMVFSGGSTFIDGTNLTEYGLQVAALPRISGKKIALTVDALNTEVVRVEPAKANGASSGLSLHTNLAFSAEALLPPETVLLVLTKPKGTQGVGHAVIISARKEPGK